MYNRDSISAIHRSLREIYHRGTVLFGGSYLYGEATEESDVDFYVVCAWPDFFYYWRHPELVLPIKQKHPHVTIMLAPKILCNKNLYYIHGQDASGAVYGGPVDIELITKNCLKLSYYNYLKFLNIRSPRDLLKSAKQIGALAIIQKTGNTTGPIFSWKYLKNNSEILDAADKNVISEASRRLLSAPAAEPDEFSSQVYEMIKRWHNQVEHCLRFQWVNYLLYNFKFIPQGNFQFLWSNPDKKLVEDIAQGLARGETGPLYEKARRTILPVIMI